MKAYVPQLRIISVDHERTTTAAQRLHHAFARHGITYPVLSVFCHLEAGRCGVKSGIVAIELDGAIVWAGKELSEEIAEQFCSSLQDYVKKQNNRG